MVLTSTAAEDQYGKPGFIPLAINCVAGQAVIPGVALELQPQLSGFSPMHFMQCGDSGLFIHCKDGTLT